MPLMKVVYEFECVVSKVVDGDTVDLILDLGFNIKIKERVRLYGINAPEIRSPNRQEKMKGDLSRKFLEQQLMESNKLFLHSKIFEHDKYGRCVGIIFTESCVDINTLMVTSGHAVAKEY